MKNDILKILLAAEIKDSSTSAIQKQIDDIQKQAKPIKIEIDTRGATNNMSQISRAIDDASKMEKAYGQAIRMRMNEHQMAGNKMNSAIDRANNQIISDAVRLEKDWAQAIKMRMNEAHVVANKANNAMDKDKNQVIAEAIRLEKDWSQAIKQRMNQAHTAALKVNRAMDSAKNKEISEAIRLEKDWTQAIKMRMDEAHTAGLKMNKAMDVSQSTAGMNTLGNSVMSTVQKFAMFAGVQLSIYGAMRAIKSGVSDVISLDTAMVELKKVTDETDATYNQFMNTAFSAGKELSRTGEEVIKATSSFARMGFSLSESTGLAKEALLMMNVGDGIENLDAATDTIISALKGFNIAGEDSIETARKINDSYNAVSNNFAINTGDLANGVQRSSAVLHQAGVSMDETIGMLTGSFEILQNMEKTSSGIQIISQRLRGIGTDGEAIEGLAPKLSAEFKDIGIELIGTNNELRSTYDILGDLAEIFPRLSSQQQAYISELTSGKRQSAVLQGLMQNWETVVDATATSMDSMGSSIAENEIYIDSIAGKIENFKSQVQSFWNTAIDSNVIKDVVDFAARFVSGLEGVVGGLDGLGSIVKIIIPLIGIKLALSFRTAYIEMAKMYAMQGMSFLPSASSIGAVAKSMLGFSTVAGGATVAVTGLTLATGGLVAVLGLVAFAFVKSAQKAKEAKEAMATSLTNSQQLSEDVNNLDRLGQKYKELSEIENKSAEQKEELIKVQRELASLYPELVTGMDEEGNKLATNTELTQALTEEKRKQLEYELLAINMIAKEKLPQLEQELELQEKRRDLLAEMLSTGDTQLPKYSAKTGELMGYVDGTEALRLEFMGLNDEIPITRGEIDELVSAMEQGDQISREYNESQKWITASEIEKQLQLDNSTDSIQEMITTLKHLGFTSDEVEAIVSGNLAQVKENHELLDIAMIENLITVKDLDEASQIASINMLNKSRELTIGYIADTKSRISAMQAEVRALSALSGASLVKKAPDKMPMPKFGDSVLDTMSGMARYELSQTNKELKTLEGSLAKIDAALANVSSIKTSGIVGDRNTKGKTTKPKKEKKKKEEYKAEADAYAEINLLLERNSTLLALNKSHQDLAGNDLEKRLRLMEEEVVLNQSRQKSLNDLNNERRKEVSELEKSLSGQGFKFSGEGDDRMIANLDAIKGKSKEVEEIFKRYIQLQKDDIPKTSQEWWNLKNSIEGVNDAISKVMKQQLSDRLANSKNWIEKRKFYDDWGADNEIEAWERVGAYIKQYYADGIIDHKEYSDYIFEIDKNLASERKRIDDEAEKKAEERRKKKIDQKNKEYEEQQKRLQALDSIQEAVVAIIRKRGEEEKKVLDNSHKREMDSLEKRHNKRKELYKQELDDFNELVQGKIDLMDEQNETEDYLEDLEKEREIAKGMQSDIDILSLDNSLTARNKTIELREQLAEQNEKIAKMQQKRERDITKKSLQDQMKDKEVDVRQREEIADELYNNEKKRLEEDYEINKEYLERKYSNEQVYAEAREAIMRGQVEVSKGVFEDIFDAYQSFENEFGKGMGILGDIIKKDFIDQLEDAQRAIKELDYLTENMKKPYSSSSSSSKSSSSSSSKSSSGGTKVSTSEREKYQADNREYSKNNSKEIDRISKEHSVDSGVARDMAKTNDREGKKIYHDGGWVSNKSGKDSPSGLKLKSDEVLAILQNGEYVLSRKMIKDISSIKSMPMSMSMPKIPSLSMGNSSEKYEINFDIQGNMDESILPEVKKMIVKGINDAQASKINKYKDVGIRRPV